jgi:hypothetical protein
MPRVDEALLDGKAFSRGSTQPMLDLTYGGQMGFSPDLKEWVSNQAYVRRHVICLLLEAPAAFNLLTDRHPDIWVRNLRALVELHPRRIEGLNAGLTVETAETLVGGGGEVQEEFVDVKQARSQPVFTFDEKYGMPIQTFLRNWITYALMDPNSKVANIGTLGAAAPDDMLADQYAASMIFIEPDPTHKKVVKAWLCTNMFPKGTGDIVGSRDIGAAMNMQELSIEFTAITQFGLGVNTFAQQLLDNINITNANPYLRPAHIQKISADVEKAPTGYKTHTENLGNTAVTG